MKTETKYGTVYSDGAATYEAGKTPEGYRVLAATDMAGSQVIVGGREEDVHLLSRPFPSHVGAVRMARLVVEKGTTVYEKWIDMKTASLWDGLCIMSGAMEKEEDPPRQEWEGEEVPDGMV